MFLNVLDTKKIKGLRSKLGLSQIELVEKIEAEVGYPMSLKTLQRIEKGDQVNEKFIHLLAIYLDKNLSGNMIEDEDSITATDLMLQNYNQKNLSARNIQNDQIYLHKVNDFNDIINIKKFDNGGRKFLFEFPPSANDDLSAQDIENYQMSGRIPPESELDLIKELLKLISEEKITDTQNYNELEEDLKNLDNLSKFNHFYKKLQSDFGTYIHGNNYRARFLDYYYEGPVIKTSCNSYTYSVFYFSKDREPARLFNCRTNKNSENFSLAIKKFNKEFDVELTPDILSSDEEIGEELERINTAFYDYVKREFNFLGSHEDLTTDKITVLPINFPKSGEK